MRRGLPPPAQVRLLAPVDWAVWREVRLAMLLDAPGAYTTTYRQAVAFDEGTWRSRLAASDTFVATVDGVPAGGCALFMEGGVDACDASLVAMWVAPAARRRGVGRVLVAAAVDRARDLGLRRVLLDVVDANPAARALYEAMGFRLTGSASPYPHDSAVTQLQMALDV